MSNKSINHWTEQAKRDGISPEMEKYYEEKIDQSTKAAYANAADIRRYHLCLAGLKTVAVIFSWLIVSNLFGSGTQFKLPAKS